MRQFSTGPFYIRLHQVESDLRIERIVQADTERYRAQTAARALPPPIVDRDPGDEDGGS